VHDPDAPLLTPQAYGFTHWVLYNIPGSISELREGEKGYTSGANSFGKPGYGGPMPPELHGVHHYYFWLLALRTDTKLAPGLSMQDLFAQIEPQVLGMNRLGRALTRVLRELTVVRGLRVVSKRGRIYFPRMDRSVPKPRT
jgi:Raf kinase inhibitor-like YbhB/YbcL family protein